MRTVDSIISDNHSSLNHFHVIGGKRNSFIIGSEKYNLTRKELCSLFIKYITKKDINDIVKYLELNSNEYIIVMKECFSIINKATKIGNVDYKDLFMERVLLDSCYSAIVLLKRLTERLRDRNEKEEITHSQLEIIKNLVSIKHKLPEKERQFVWHIWCYRANKKLTNQESIVLTKLEHLFLKGDFDT